MSSLLMPCPFCSGRGAKIETKRSPGEGDLRGWGTVAWVECPRCNAQGPRSDELGLQTARAAAREAWNNRK